jgi:putative sterol carrier protein
MTMAKFMTEEYFSQLQSALSQDPKWSESTKSLKTSIAMNVTDQGQNFLLGVESGVTTIKKVPAGTPAEFTFDGTYETWSRVARGELDLQSAVLKGQLRFKGSLTKILMYKDRFVRVAEVMRDIPKEY